MTNGEKFKDVFGFGVDGNKIIAVNSAWWDCDFQVRKPKTNANRIRSMSDEELAKVIKHSCDIEDHIPIEWCANRGCGYQCSLDWLKQKVE